MLTINHLNLKKDIYVLGSVADTAGIRDGRPMFIFKPYQYLLTHNTWLLDVTPCGHLFLIGSTIYRTKRHQFWKIAV